MRCKACGKEVESVVSFSAPGEPSTPEICLRCFRRAGINIVASAKKMAANAKARAAKGGG